jgi:hypothetical protein
MFKSLVRRLYKYFCSEEQEFFEIKKKQLTEAEKKQVYLECKMMLDTGVLQKVVDMIVAESEVNQLYNDVKSEIKEREGIAKLMTRIKQFANKAIDKVDKIEKYSIT